VDYFPTISIICDHNQTTLLRDTRADRRYSHFSLQHRGTHVCASCDKNRQPTQLNKAPICYQIYGERQEAWLLLGQPTLYCLTADYLVISDLC